MWMDRNAVHLLSSDGSPRDLQVRRVDGEQQPIPAPQLLLSVQRVLRTGQPIDENTSAMQRAKGERKPS
ncbi:uncharacterized protein IUM83_01667 [Phytophthora cinnamomi]|uniref:uncharacterized protein n=1 Tax=Phytophthora cinnamomi TaxID=4785 RepID=UPI00355A85A7|nr:hypothetical protein IUM83_01667 [Phytophthora cinnamomi]